MLPYGPGPASLDTGEPNCNRPISRIPRCAPAPMESEPGIRPPAWQGASCF